MRILLFSERLRTPYDEGIKQVAAHLGRALAAGHDVLALTSHGSDDPEYGIRNVDANRLLLSPRLRKEMRHFGPQIIVYVPTACGTVFSFFRARVLRYYGSLPTPKRGYAVRPGGRRPNGGVPKACVPPLGGGNVRTALIALQPRHYTPVGKFWIGHLAPDWVFCQSMHTSRTLRQLGCRTALLPPAVDTQRFLPASRAEKETLRRQYKIPASATVVTHVGHLNGPRNLACFLSLQSEPGYQGVVVASTSTRQDRDLAATLRAAGVTVINTYVPNVEDIYRLSDAYVFAAEQYTAAIEVPLSVLEAMACNLPVVCTPFGGLQDFFPAGQGLFYWQPGTPLRSVVEEAVSGPCATRALVEPHTWAAAANALVDLLQGSEVPLAPQRGGTEYLSPPRRGAGGEVVQ